MVDADNAFVAQYEKFVRGVASQLVAQLGLDCDFEDVVAFGLAGLLEARARYDASKGIAFKSFAYYRVRGAMEYLVEDGRTVIWIGQPTMRSDSFESKIAVINQIYQDQAALVEGVSYLDSRSLLSPNGYTAYGPGPEGAEAQLRASDGIHLTDSGGQVISVEVLRQLAERGFLPASP